jgi:GTP-binding protein EngB required for normal cell division
MEKTISEFKQQQGSILKILNQLNDFLEIGEQIGVNIDDSVKLKIANAISSVETQKLRVALIGGFSEGKTSIAAAWMEKLDKSNMKISQQESSDEIVVYEVGNDIELVDTPGLFGFKEKYNTDNKTVEKYKDITQKYISEAHLILYVMNSTNPIKESHKDELYWLFRVLNLLPRTIFVLSKFDDIADIEDEDSYAQKFGIKKNNVLSRLKDMIALTDKESSELSIVAVSANPFDMGLEYWLKHMSTFKKLSHISELQNATFEKIRNNGGVSIIINEARKTVIQDVLHKQLPVSKEIDSKITKEIDNLSKIVETISNNIDSLESKITKARIKLREFATEYFSDLILQARGTSMETIGNFVEREIGSDGININSRVQNEFERQIGIVSLELQKVETNFNAEINTFNQALRDCGKQGIRYLSSSGIINKDTVKLARDTIVTGAKTIGLDISKYLKFKPWGATKLASGANVVLAVLGLTVELWDSYDKHRKEKEFRNAIEKIVQELEKQKKDIIELLNSDDFINKFFQSYVEMRNNLKSVKNDIEQMKKHQQAFKEWVKMGEVIDVEFSEIKKLV